MPEFIESDPIFLVDFNNVADGGRLIKASLRRSPQGWHPEIGSRAFLQDSEGNRCWAAVAEIVNPILLFEPDDSTWVSGESVEATGVPVVEPTFA
jgi:hypothetical protein